MMEYTNSSLVNYTKLSPNHYVGRNKIDTITIHCVCGQCSVETIGEIFAKTSRKASSNYAVGLDGRIGMYVEEKNAAWTSSNKANDMRAITIEVASDTTAPYRVNDVALASTVKLVADICKRNNIKKLMWENNKSLIGQIDKQNMTVHRWFSNTACPGDYLMGKMGYIAEQANKLIGSTITKTETTKTETKASSGELYTVNTYALNIRKGPGTNYGISGVITNNGTFTIVEKKEGPGAKMWGKLKSGAGWIALDFCIKK